MTRVGVVGLGIIGGAVTRLLAKAGHAPLAFDIDPAARDRLAAECIGAAPDIAALAREADVILLSLPSEAASFAVVRAIVAAAPAARTIVELGTLGVSAKLALAALAAGHGHILLDCPISGTGAQAAVGDIALYASGDAAEIARLAPLFGSFARTVIDLGALGNGSRMKLVANLLVAIHNVAAAEAMLLGQAAGLDGDAIVAAVAAGAGASRIFGLRAPMMAHDRFLPATMKLDVWAKDMAAIAAFAEEHGVATPLLAATAPLYAAAVQAGRGEQDTAAVYAVLRDRNDRERADGQ